jgi:hypothetical protein
MIKISTNQIIGHVIAEGARAEAHYGPAISRVFHGPTAKVDAEAWLAEIRARDQMPGNPYPAYPFNA